MVRTIHDTKKFSVAINAFDLNGDDQFGKVMQDLTFMQAADYAEHAVSYFRFAMMDERNSAWVIVQIEVGRGNEIIELIEITRDTI